MILYSRPSKGHAAIFFWYAWILSLIHGDASGGAIGSAFTALDTAVFGNFIIQHSFS